MHYHSINVFVKRLWADIALTDPSTAATEAVIKWAKEVHSAEEDGKYEL